MKREILFPVLVCASGISLVSMGVLAEEACAPEAVAPFYMALPNQNFPVGGTSVSAVGRARLTLVRDGTFYRVSYDIGYAFDGYVAALTATIQSNIPAQNCNNHYWLTTTNPLSVEGGMLRSDFDVEYLRRECASADVPCPTFSKPLRFCTKYAITDTFRNHSQIKVLVTPTYNEASGLTIDVAPSVHVGDVPDHVKYIGAILGGITGGAIGGGLGTLAGSIASLDQMEKFEKKTRSDIENRISASGVKLPIPLDDSELSLVTKLSFRNVAFKAQDFVRDNPEPALVLNFVSQQLRARTACGLFSQLYRR